jgi:hypothetical protein
MTIGSASLVVIAICNVVWLMSVIIALALLRALARRDRSLITCAPAEPREYTEPARARKIRRLFLGARAGALAEIPVGIGRLFQPNTADQTATTVRSDPARD